jgi:hypothetical protein
MCQSRHMRLHITLEDDLVAELDKRIGKRQRSAFIARLLRRALEDERRWDLILSALGSISEEGHIWDPDPGVWVRESRAQDPRPRG